MPVGDFQMRIGLVGSGDRYANSLAPVAGSLARLSVISMSGEPHSAQRGHMQLRRAGIITPFGTSSTPTRAHARQESDRRSKLGGVRSLRILPTGSLLRVGLRRRYIAAWVVGARKSFGIVRKSPLPLPPQVPARSRLSSTDIRRL